MSQKNVNPDPPYSRPDLPAGPSSVRGKPFPGWPKLESLPPVSGQKNETPPSGAIGWITVATLDWLRKGWRVPAAAIETAGAGMFVVPVFLSPRNPAAAEREAALLHEIARLKAQASKYHRRAQQAEAACDQFMRRWDAHGGPRGGSFGRALASAAYYHQRERADGAEAQLAALRTHGESA
jgi:hypothetical protein